MPRPLLSQFLDGSTLNFPLAVAGTAALAHITTDPAAGWIAIPLVTLLVIALPLARARVAPRWLFGPP